MDLFLVYDGLRNELCVNGYTDAGLQIDHDASKSQSRFVFLLNIGTVRLKI